ncbi:MAG: hypothetical protein ABWY12_19615 [Burkholderiales bacterium]
MYIVAIGWLYVVLLMAFSANTVVAGFVTFFLFGVLPVGALIIVTGGSKRSRRRRREAIEQASAEDEKAGDGPPHQ